MTYLADNVKIKEDLGAEARKTSERFKAERVIGQWEELIEELI